MSRDVLLSLEIWCLNTPVAFCEQNYPTIFPKYGQFFLFYRAIYRAPFWPTYNDRLGAHLVPTNPRKSQTGFNV